MKQKYLYIALSLIALATCVIILFTDSPLVVSLPNTSPASTPPLPGISEQYPFFIFNDGWNKPVLPVPGQSSGRVVKIVVETIPSEVYFYYQGQEAREEPHDGTVRFQGTLEINYQNVIKPRDFEVLLMGGERFQTGEDGDLIVFKGASVQAWTWEIELEPDTYVATFRIVPAETNTRGHNLPPLEFSWFFTVVK